MDIDLFYRGKAFRRITREDLTPPLVKLLMHVEGIQGSIDDFADALVHREMGECWVRVDFPEHDDDLPF